MFVRLTGCPLRCHYCDTEHAFRGGNTLSLQQILQQVKGYGVSHVCVTGGEPLAQSGTMALLKSLCDQGHHTSLETSGALTIEGIDARVEIVMDLKGPSSGEQSRNLFTNLEWLKPRDQIKLLVANEEDFSWATDMIYRHQLTQRCTVLMSPVADQLQPQRLVAWILEQRLPVRFQLQLHKVLWGNEVGR